jgi:hypothetical protein
MVYLINHPAVRADGARDELHLNDERHISEINDELLELIGKSHLSFQMSSFPLNFVGTHAHWIEK